MNSHKQLELCKENDFFFFFLPRYQMETCCFSVYDHYVCTSCLSEPAGDEQGDNVPANADMSPEDDA